MDLKPRHIEAIVAAGLVPNAGSLDAESLYNAANEALRNGWHEVQRRTADGGAGEFDVILWGIPGAYYVTAMEYDDLGPFDTEAEGVGAMEGQYHDCFNHKAGT